MPTLKSLHERNFAGEPLKSFKVYNDPFGGNEVCIELIFVDGKVEYLCIGPGRPEIVSTARCYEDGLVQQQLAPEHDLAHAEDALRRKTGVSRTAI